MSASPAPTISTGGNSRPTPLTQQDMFHTTLLGGSVNESLGVESLPRFRYRARAGWSNGPWSVTGFMNFQSHFFHTQNAPPNVNGDFCASNGGLDAVRQWRHLYLRHLRLHQHPSVLLHVRPVPRLQHDGRPANEYLRNIGIQLVVQNITDRRSAYGYRISSGGGNPCTCDILSSIQGRTISLIVTKEW